MNYALELISTFCNLCHVKNAGKKERKFFLSSTLKIRDKKRTENGL